MHLGTLKYPITVHNANSWLCVNLDMATIKTPELIFLSMLAQGNMEDARKVLTTNIQGQERPKGKMSTLTL